MKKSILASIISLLLISAVGCDNSNENSNTGTPSQDKNKTEQTTQSKPDSKNTQSDEALFSQKIEKGNLWLATFNEDFGTIIQKKTGRISGTININLLDNTKTVLTSLSSDKGKTIDITPFKVLETETDQIKRMKASSSIMSVRSTFSMHLSESGAERAQESFEFMKTLSPTLPELDTVGNAYGESYVDLYRKLLKLGDYLVVKETYRLDDFAQANTLYEEVKNAYAKLVDEKEKAAEAYENYYQAMHIEELELVKKEGFVVRYQIMQSLDTVTNTLDSINPDKVDVAALSAAITKIEEQSIELGKVFGNEALLNKENMKGTDYSVKEYLKLYQQLVIELKVLEKKLNENKDISTSINTISNKYKYLIENYNSLIAK
ncbi:DUF3829 domain-containing protein [Proteus hauseri]|uniref:YiiG family protein n=1 Tax=Proteus cibi TaxID=2050966 RepID=A0ABU6EIE8_9GAMM|nr:MULTISPECIES: DUF3829 domain-containing protein [Proteus]MBG6031271.1 DUF3829 domain-containing protein [Proteus hauseri]MBS6210098.1 DUF3829 domain-containing protein [Proteus hauseri]MEB6858465.1 YiiG family protein [Proteus cibi]MEB7090112.1 YiiG family protein [Proteus cibi]